MLTTATQALAEAKDTDHTIWFYAGSFVYWKGNTAATKGEAWTRCEIQGHGHFPRFEVRVEGETTSRQHPRQRAEYEIKELARLFDACFKAGRIFQGEEIRRAINWNGSV